eukprot:2405790-Pleurochrysis_carterae.AAC.1
MFSSALRRYVSELHTLVYTVFRYFSAKAGKIQCLSPDPGLRQLSGSRPRAIITSRLLFIMVDAGRAHQLSKNERRHSLSRRLASATDSSDSQNLNEVYKVCSAGFRGARIYE